MEKIIVDKEFLEGYKSLSVALENCDVYDICVEDILDIYCEAELIAKNGNEYRTKGGFIKISASASEAPESFAAKNHEIDMEWDHCLKERLEMCGSGVDMTSFCLRNKNNRKIQIYVPYDPLKSIMHGGEIETSNCSSLEIDSDGNMIISFGEYTKQPKRKDNNYAELIAGWKDAFGENEPEVLQVKIDELSTFGLKNENYSVSFKFCKKFCKRKFAELVFMDCKNVRVEMSFPQDENCEIVMSKMEDGRIYVGFVGLGMEFICASVFEYDYYCNRVDE